MLLNQVSLFQYDEGIGGDALKKCAKQGKSGDIGPALAASHFWIVPAM